uniref:FliM/FliN family flagellar motor switch protein n=1 Tax=Schlesneria paludicola TaxID=360056 RepID=A0A7C2NXD6_9PLAN
MPLPRPDDVDSMSTTPSDNRSPPVDILPQESDANQLAAGTVDPRARLRQIPVPISVRLAEKRIPVSHLLGITPGALIMFNKSAEDLLDLYVNNTRLCRGEAVKVGETFGLKINQMAMPQESASRVVHG